MPGSTSSRACPTDGGCTGYSEGEPGFQRGGAMFVTIVEGAIDSPREADLVSAWDEITTSLPDGLIESFLLRGKEGTWRIATVWESEEIVVAMRAAGEPAAPAMFRRAGSDPSVSMWTVERHAVSG